MESSVQSIAIGQRIIAKTLLAGKDSTGGLRHAEILKRRKSPNPTRKLTVFARCIRMNPSCTGAVDVRRGGLSQGSARPEISGELSR
jgi:hypothetical protein